MGERVNPRAALENGFAWRAAAQHEAGGRDHAPGRGSGASPSQRPGGSHLPAAAPLSADQAASAVTAPASALSASSGTSSSMAERSGGGGGPEDAPELGRRR